MALTAVHIINRLFDGYFFSYGVIPRNIDQLPFILTAPFIHSSWAHLVNNMIGLSIFSALCLLQSIRFYLACSVFIIICSSLLVWLFGRDAMHIGASGWVFGLWSLCIALAWYERSVKNIAVGLVVIVFYGGMAHGLLPTSPEVSFEYHLFGALAGMASAAIYAKKFVESSR